MQPPAPIRFMCPYCHSVSSFKHVRSLASLLSQESGIFFRPLRGIFISSLIALYSHGWARLKRILAQLIMALYLNKALFVTFSLWSNSSSNHTTCTIQELAKGLLTDLLLSHTLFFPSSFRYSSCYEPRMTKTLHKLLTRQLIAREKRCCALNPTYLNSIEI